MQITLNTENLTELDRKVLALIGANGNVSAKVIVSGDIKPSSRKTPVEKAAEKPVEKATKPEPVKKAAEKPAPKPEPVAEPDEAPAEAPDEAPANTSELTMSDAVEAATRLVSDGKSTVVRAALKSVGASRVGKIPADKIDEFLAALNA